MPLKGPGFLLELKRRLVRVPVGNLRGACSGNRRDRVGCHFQFKRDSYIGYRVFGNRVSGFLRYLLENDFKGQACMCQGD